MSVKHEEEIIRSGWETRMHATATFPGRAVIKIHATVQALTVGRPTELHHSCRRLLNWVSHIYKGADKLEPVQKSIKPVIKVKYSVAR